MAKYHTYTSNNDTGLLCANEITKDYWQARQAHLIGALEITDEEFERAIWDPIHEISASGIVWLRDWNGLRSNMSEWEGDISQADVEKALEDLSQQAKIFVKNSQDLPSYYDGMVDQIKAVDISGITFPVSALNWRKVLIDNGITIPFFGEWS